MAEMDESHNNRRMGISVEPISEEDAMNLSIELHPKDNDTINFLLKVLSTNLLFEHLDDQEQADVFNAMFPIYFHTGDIIANQGDEEDHFFVIGCGEIEVYQNNKPLRILREGDNFGELSLMYSTHRATTLKAKNDVKLWGINRNTYRRILMCSTIRKREWYLNILDKIPMFQNLDRLDRLTLVETMQPVTFKDGEIVVKQDTMNSEFYVIVEGTAVVLEKDASSNETHIVAQLGTNMCFGETALFGVDPEPYTTVAQGQLKCIKISRSSFELVCDAEKNILKKTSSKM